MKNKNYSTKYLSNVGVVIIGRNEGERLRRALESIPENHINIVYVDSASTDNSNSIAQELGATVLDLDMSIPFTAGRARNAGFEYISKNYPEVKYVQFIDGDCTIFENWMDAAVDFMEKNKRIGMISGIVSERNPEYSIYNKLCDLEWKLPIGETNTCGGIFMIRTALFQALGGFNASLIAGEEPELCLRIRQTQYKIWRLKDDMALHDANITHFKQWWKRNVRSGYAYAEGTYMYGFSEHRYRLLKSLNIWIWSLYPVFVFFLSNISTAYFLLFSIYPIQFIRLSIRSGFTNKLSWISSLFTLVGKFAEFQGQLKFLIVKLTFSRSKIIEYK